MTDLPAPLTSPDCDLRGYDFMPLFATRLLDSDLYALSTGAEFKAALTLWCKAWLQVPAGSLPADERILAHLSMTGSTWDCVRDIALHGWMQCSDGRLYHPLIAQEAIKAFAMRRKERERKARQRARLRSGASLSHGTTEGRDASFRADRDSDKDSDSESPGTPRQAPHDGQRLSDSWMLTDELAAYAHELGLSPAREAESFCDYWRSTANERAVKHDWNAAFRIWCRKSAERRQTRRASSSRPSSTTEQNRSELLALARGALS
ncbi:MULTISPECIES: DUF1376 domain-containing protein [unclassified Saccharibacter]|uniref:DUF1376 domain-containing protein n=1 Tax=unclassified Saccharibacter TaxID=2648722 RepID=UPI0013221EE3|nr:MULTISPECIES: DUF1376 domain-containing protein [unclassified Saccharibacter]MXV36856.1 DUF1376 domain-containing protein [Saccharibacter sp. EH611]MXV58654.1 DUF1376 domain-containing protein [Saccharibacter sp. EH70]MXV66160.1 DUF1376 domain-containing protein [Saccharibacter sp. EH60]